MITFRKIRRRRISFLKLLLVFSLAIGVLFWIYQVRTFNKESPEGQHKQEQSFVFPGSVESNVHPPKDLQKRFIPLFEKYTKSSSFRNPALLHKLRAKASESSRKKALEENNNSVKLTDSDRDMPVMKVTPGLGEEGVPVHLPPEEQKLADKLFNKAAFNVYLSDRVSLNRSVPDSRNPK